MDRKLGNFKPLPLCNFNTQIFVQKIQKFPFLLDLDCREYFEIMVFRSALNKTCCKTENENFDTFCAPYSEVKNCINEI